MENNTGVQTILGAGGAIGIELAAALKSYTSHLRLVSRHPRKININDELIVADICDPAQLDQAVAGSDVVYLTVGFEYNIHVWREKWPPLMKSVLDACKRHHARLDLSHDSVSSRPHPTKQFDGS